MKLNYNHTIYACFAGYITQAVVNNLAPLLFIIFHTELSVDLKSITMLVSVNFLVQLAVDIITPFFADRFGYKSCIVTAHIFAAAGLFMMGVLPGLMPAFYALLISVVTYAVGGGIIEVLISPITEACPTKNKAAVMSLLHSFYCWGTMAVVLLSTIFLHLFGKGSWQLLCCIWALFPILNALFFTLVPVNHLTQKDESMSLRELFSQRVFALFIVLMIAAGASEQAMSQWASFFVESALGVPKALGDIFGICTFSAMMGIARIWYSKFSDRFDLIGCLVISGSISTLSYVCVGLFESPVISLIGCALCGLSAGILWPGVFSMASARISRGGTLMFAILALAGDLGCSSGPALAGFVSQAADSGLRVGLLAAAVFPITLILAATAVKRSK